eukprot:CCRYP_016713-RA/>CCRYP_016713-RA protein AED:0.41 eAED:0.41 QI:0/-1/0/1/-1/0/1/0/53
MQVTISSMLGSMPGVCAFGCNMFLNVTLIADWQAIAQHREEYVNENLCRTNTK